MNPSHQRKLCSRSRGPNTDHDFTITYADDVTPSQYRDVYGATGSEVALTGKLAASNHTGHSTSLTFTLRVTYDASAQFGPPSAHQSQNRWSVDEVYETYETLTALPAISIPWAAVTDGHREWSAGTPDGVTFQCSDPGGATNADWPDDGEKDSALFSVSSAATAQSGTITVSFKDAPDFENPSDDEGTTTVNGVDEPNPGDNVYHLRVTSDHDVHDLGSEGNDTGCNGSAVDIKIRVKDVKPPIAPPNLSGAFRSDDDTIIDLTWSAVKRLRRRRNHHRVPRHRRWKPASTSTSTAGVPPKTGRPPPKPHRHVGRTHGTDPHRLPDPRPRPSTAEGRGRLGRNHRRYPRKPESQRHRALPTPEPWLHLLQVPRRQTRHRQIRQPNPAPTPTMTPSPTSSE